MIVIKLGGSLLQSGLFQQCLDKEEYQECFDKAAALLKLLNKLKVK
ncbi:hypothetical protein [Methyloglobulus sp.]